MTKTKPTDKETRAREGLPRAAHHEIHKFVRPLSGRS